MTTTNSSRSLAKIWIYPRHEAYEKGLRKSNADWFLGRNDAVSPRMNYLLAQWEDWPRNIILEGVADYIKAERKRRVAAGEGFPLHKYIHHGLSSQAMLFNLVGPLVVEQNLDPLKQAFVHSGIEWPPEQVTPKFEVENRDVFHENFGQPTSIDLVIQGKDNTRSLYIEAKLVEREFGGCSFFAGGDCDGRNPSDRFGRCYLHHIKRHYWTLLEKYGFLTGLAGSSPICPLAMYYQFFREVLFSLESGGDFVLLYDQRNPSFYAGDINGERGLMPFLITFVPQELRSRIHAISIQEIVAAYQEYGDLPWLGDFETKYNLKNGLKANLA